MSYDYREAMIEQAREVGRLEAELRSLQNAWELREFHVTRLIEAARAVLAQQTGEDAILEREALYNAANQLEIPF